MVKSDTGSAFFIKNKQHINDDISAYFGAGKLLIGFVLNIDRYRINILKKEWPFCSMYNDKLLLPIPSSFNEWSFLKKLLDSLKIKISIENENIAIKSIQNSILRLDLSKEKKLKAPIIIEGLKTPPNFNSPLFPFQEVALKYIESLGYRAIVGDDMGLGKTTVAIAAALNVKSKKIIVVTRAVALGGWQRAFKTWSDYKVLTASGKVPLKTKRKDGVIKIPDGCVTLNSDLTEIDTNVVLINYELLTAWKDELSKYNADMIVFDEVHAIKEPKAQRSQVAYELISNIEHAIGLTGTPINNKPLELYHILNVFQPRRWGEFFSFVKRYCNAYRKVISRDWKNCKIEIQPDGSKKRIPTEKYAWDFSGSRLETELYRRLRSHIMVRRLKDDVLDLLPPIEETIPIEPSKRYIDVENGIISLIDDLGSSINDKKKKSEVSLHELFAAAALDKIEWVTEWLKSFLEDTDNKIVIFFQYQMVGQKLQDLLNQWGIKHTNLWGNKPDKNGDFEFQNNPDIRVALCSYSLAREAVTLTSASYQLSMEYPWVPGWAEQARDRTRRIGQKNAVTYYYPILVGSAEERIVRALLKKQDIISVIMQGVHRKSINIDTSCMSNTYV